MHQDSAEADFVPEILIAARLKQTGGVEEIKKFLILAKGTATGD